MTEISSQSFEQSIDQGPIVSPPLFRDFKIIPIKALPLVAAVVIGLVISIAGNWTWALDFYHVVGGGFWTAIDLFLGFVIGPIMNKMSIPARMEFTSKLMPKVVLIMPTLVTMTLGSGFQLARKLNNLSTGAPAHGWLVLSFAIVGVMTVIAMGILQPANVTVLFELKKEHPNGAVIAKLMKRFIYTAGIMGAMQVGTLVIMTRVASL
ncbi:MAG: hypothetical protein M0Z45_06880 [Actinomycetota bacterium]|nr:hypothetical protein [Actinomycetota bacterium]